MAKAKVQNTTIVGICWYTQDDWARVKETATDPDVFESTFTEWEAMAEVNLSYVLKAYPNAQKVLIDADEFLAWCHLRRRPNNSDARAEFVSDKVRANNTAKR